MKKLSFLMSALAMLLFASCQNDGTDSGNELPEGTTYMGLTIKLPSHSDGTRAYTGRYDGVDAINTVDVYLLSADGQSVIYSHRYNNNPNEIVFDQTNTNGPIIMLAEPFATVPGDKGMMVIVNCPLPLMSTPPAGDYVYSVSSALPLSSIASLSTTKKITVDVWGDVYADVVTMSGRYPGTFNIQDNVSPTDVTADDKNRIAIDVSRVPSKVSVTTNELQPTVVNDNGVTLGQITRITWSIAQGSNKVYLFPQMVAGTTKVNTPGYNYVPGTDYNSSAPNWYLYDDLQNTNDLVPLNPDPQYLNYLPGKYFLENTHEEGADQATSNYRQGNTAYVLVRAIFTPAADQIADGGTLTDGTFYVGNSDGNIYSTMENALNAIAGQKVRTYEGGKMLYYLWLNPDDVERPVNSPTVRNSIYHINIRSFKDLGTNWNPLDPSTDNPDQKPGGDNPDSPEPDSPMDPTNPLSPTDTYMTVDTSVLPWYTYSYEIDL